MLQTTDMALIVSPGQNEIEQMKKHGLDIVPHRQADERSQPPLDEKFKDPDDPLRLVFLCAMWLTGFDAPSCSTVYLDKPMRNHTLMQTIARANRVFPGKHSGMIVDYANVFASLEKALAIYGAGKGGKNPVKDKQKLVADLRKAVDAATAFCAARQVILPAIEQLAAGSMERLQRIDDAVNALISPDPLRREFLGHERLVSTLYGAVKPDPAALEFAGRVACLAAIADAIRTKLNPNPADITEVMGDIGKLLDASITGVDMPAKPAPVMDLSKIDFEALRSRFKESKHKNTDLEVLKAAIRAQLEKLIRLNKTRADFAEKFEELIESYNAGSRNIEELFEELLKLSRNLSEEQQRHVRENMTEEELVIFDILTRPAPGVEHRGTRRGEESRPRTPDPAQAAAGAQLAAESRPPAPNSSSPSRTCWTPACREPTRRTLPAEVLRPLRARLRELPRTGRRRLCFGDVTKTMSVNPDISIYLNPVLQDWPPPRSITRGQAADRFLSPGGPQPC